MRVSGVPSDAQAIPAQHAHRAIRFSFVYFSCVPDSPTLGPFKTMPFNRIARQEPHGMLLEGVVRHLPRTHFHVTVCPIVAAGKRLSPRLADAADAVVQLPMKLGVAREVLGGLR